MLPGHFIPSKEIPDLSLARAGNLHLLAVLGYRASSDKDVVATQHLANLVIRVRLGLVFAFNHLFDLEFDLNDRELFAIRIFLVEQAWWKAWFSSCITIVFCTLFAVAGLYPALLPSNLDPAFSRTAFNTQSSPKTLAIMLGVALVMVPIVIIYQAWVYCRFSAPVSIDTLLEDESY